MLAAFFLSQLFAAQNAKGAAVVVDFQTGAVIDSLNGEQKVLPLSLVKIWLAEDLWKHGFEENFDDMLVNGLDQPGKDRALALRKKIGGKQVLMDLHQLGLDLDLQPDASDAEWGDALSIGEQHALVSPLQVAKFLRTASPKLQRAMRECVLRGTAKSITPQQLGKKWQLGGKTGSGPANAKPYDGWFAGLIFVEEKPRYAFAIHVEAKGFGGGVAAAIAAQVAERLAP